MRRVTWLGAACLAGAAGLPWLLATAEPEHPPAAAEAPSADPGRPSSPAGASTEAAGLLEVAGLLAEQGEAEGAADLHRQVVARFTEDRAALAVALAHLQSHHARLRERAEAQHYYTRRVAIAPGDARAHADWAHAVLFSFQDFDDAIPAARKALALGGDDAVRRDLAMALYARWAYLLIARRDRAAAELHLDEARRLMPDTDAVIRAARGRPVMDFAVLALTRPDSPVVTGRLAIQPPR